MSKFIHEISTSWKKTVNDGPYIKLKVDFNILKREKPKTVRTPEYISAVAESACEAPSTSIHRRSQQFNILETSLRRILHEDLGMTPYKVQLVHELKPIDNRMHFRFAKLACDRFTEDADFGKKKIIFSDEAHFDLGGYVNKQNCRIWGTENPQA